MPVARWVLGHTPQRLIIWILVVFDFFFAKAEASDTHHVQRQSRFYLSIRPILSYIAFPFLWFIDGYIDHVDALYPHNSWAGLRIDRYRRHIRWLYGRMRSNSRAPSPSAVGYNDFEVDNGEGPSSPHQEFNLLHSPPDSEPMVSYAYGSGPSSQGAPYFGSGVVNAITAVFSFLYMVPIFLVGQLRRFVPTHLPSLPRLPRLPRRRCRPVRLLFFLVALCLTVYVIIMPTPNIKSHGQSIAKLAAAGAAALSVPGSAPVPVPGSAQVPALSTAPGGNSIGNVNASAEVPSPSPPADEAEEAPFPGFPIGFPPGPPIQFPEFLLPPKKKICKPQCKLKPTSLVNYPIHDSNTKGWVDHDDSLRYKKIPSLNRGPIVYGRMDNGTMIYSTYVDNVLVHGTVVSGTVVNGNMGDGSLGNGTFSQGSFSRGDLVNGTLFNDAFIPGTFKRLKFANGSAVSGEFKSTFVDGRIVDANIVEGTFFNGTVANGTMALNRLLNGKKAEIHDGNIVNGAMLYFPKKDPMANETLPLDNALFFNLSSTFVDPKPIPFNGTLVYDNGTTIYPDATLVDGNGTTVYPDGTRLFKNGTFANLGGTFFNRTDPVSAEIHAPAANPPAKVAIKTTQPMEATSRELSMEDMADFVNFIVDKHNLGSDLRVKTVRIQPVFDTETYNNEPSYPNAVFPVDLGTPSLTTIDQPLDEFSQFQRIAAPGRRALQEMSRHEIMQALNDFSEKYFTDLPENWAFVNGQLDMKRVKKVKAWKSKAENARHHDRDRHNTLVQERAWNQVVKIARAFRRVKMGPEHMDAVRLENDGDIRFLYDDPRDVSQGFLGHHGYVLDCGDSDSGSCTALEKYEEESSEEALAGHGFGHGQNSTQQGLSQNATQGGPQTTQNLPVDLEEVIRQAVEKGMAAAFGSVGQSMPAAVQNQQVKDQKPTQKPTQKQIQKQDQKQDQKQKPKKVSRDLPEDNGSSYPDEFVDGEREAYEKAVAHKNMAKRDKAPPPPPLKQNKAPPPLKQKKPPVVEKPPVPDAGIPLGHYNFTTEGVKPGFARVMYRPPGRHQPVYDYVLSAKQTLNISGVDPVTLRFHGNSSGFTVGEANSPNDPVRVFDFMEELTIVHDEDVYVISNNGTDIAYTKFDYEARKESFLKYIDKPADAHLFDHVSAPAPLQKSHPLPSLPLGRIALPVSGRGVRPDPGPLSLLNEPVDGKMPGGTVPQGQRLRRYKDAPPDLPFVRPGALDASGVMFGVSTTYSRLHNNDFAAIDDWARWLTDGQGNSNGAFLYVSLHRPRGKETETVVKLLEESGIFFDLVEDWGHLAEGVGGGPQDVHPLPVVPDADSIRYSNMLLWLQDYNFNNFGDGRPNQPQRPPIVREVDGNKYEELPPIERYPPWHISMYGLIDDDIFVPDMRRLVSKLREHRGLVPTADLSHATSPASNDYWKYDHNLWLGFPSDPWSDWTFHNGTTLYNQFAWEFNTFGSAVSTSGLDKRFVNRDVGDLLPTSFGGGIVLMAADLAHRVSNLDCLRTSLRGNTINTVYKANRAAFYRGAHPEPGWEEQMFRCAAKSLSDVKLRLIPSYYSPTDVAQYGNLWQSGADQRSRFARQLARMNQYNGGTHPFVMHNYRHWHNFDVGAAHQVTDVAGPDSFLQRFVFPNGWVLVNGHSLTHYAGLRIHPLERHGEVDFSGREREFAGTQLAARYHEYKNQRDYYDALNVFLENPQRPNDPAAIDWHGEQQTYRILETSVLPDGSVIQAYVRRRDTGLLDLSAIGGRMSFENNHKHLAVPASVKGGLEGSQADASSEAPSPSIDEVIVLLWEKGQGAPRLFPHGNRSRNWDSWFPWRLFFKLCLGFASAYEVVAKFCPMLQIGGQTPMKRAFGLTTVFLRRRGVLWRIRVLGEDVDAAIRRTRSFQRLRGWTLWLWNPIAYRVHDGYAAHIAELAALTGDLATRLNGMRVNEWGSVPQDVPAMEEPDVENAVPDQTVPRRAVVGKIVDRAARLAKARRGKAKMVYATAAATGQHETETDDDSACGVDINDPRFHGFGEAGPSGQNRASSRPSSSASPPAKSSMKKTERSYESYLQELDDLQSVLNGASKTTKTVRFAEDKVVDGDGGVADNEAPENSVSDKESSSPVSDNVHSPTEDSSSTVEPDPAVASRVEAAPGNSTPETSSQGYPSLDESTPRSSSLDDAPPKEAAFEEATEEAIEEPEETIEEAPEEPGETLEEAAEETTKGATKEATEETPEITKETTEDATEETAEEPIEEPAKADEEPNEEPDNASEWSSTGGMSAAQRAELDNTRVRMNALSAKRKKKEKKKKKNAEKMKSEEEEKGEEKSKDENE